MADLTTIETTTTINTDNEQLLASVKASAPSAARDTAIALLESGAVDASSSIGDLARALDKYNRITPQ